MFFNFPQNNTFFKCITPKHSRFDKFLMQRSPQISLFHQQNLCQGIRLRTVKKKTVVGYLVTCLLYIFEISLVQRQINLRVATDSFYFSFLPVLMINRLIFYCRVRVRGT